MNRLLVVILLVALTASFCTATLTNSRVQISADSQTPKPYETQIPLFQSEKTLLKDAEAFTSTQLEEIGESHEITLITGDKVVVTTQPDGRYTFEVRSPDTTEGVSFQTLYTPEGTYLIPNNVEIEKLDKELFNIEYLIENNYQQMPNLPVLIELKGNGNIANTFQSVTTMVSDLDGQVTGRSTNLGVLTAQLQFDSISLSSQSLLARPDINKIWLDRKVHVELNESVPLIGASAYWSEGYNGSGVKIAILDTGIDATHPDLDDLDDNPATIDPKVIVARDFTTDNFTEDLFGHGTHCAGIAAGTGQASGYIYKGVAPGAYLLNIKVLTAGGWGYESWIIAGIEYAALGEDGIANTGDEADILSMSLGGYSEGDGTDPVSQAVDWATDQGAVCVVAAGNDGPEMFTVAAPGVARKAITVGATTKTDDIAEFSSRGPSSDFRLKPDVVAPGVNIVAPRASGTDMGSPVGDFYTSASGTSMATPHVAGAAALILQANPDWAPVMVKSAIMGYAKVIDDVGLLDQGAGRIQMPEAAEATLLAVEPSLSFGRLELGKVNSADLTLMNLGNASITANITTYTTCEGVEKHYVNVSHETVEIPAGGNSVISVQAGPLDELATEGWYEGRVIISYEGKTLRVPYVFSVFSWLSATVYDTDNTTEIYAPMFLVTYPDMEFVDMLWQNQGLIVQSGDYALMAASGEIDKAGEQPDFSRMFMLEKLVTVPNLSDVEVRFSLAEANVCEIPTVNADGDNLITHCYAQYFNGDPYYDEEIGATVMSWGLGYGWFGFDLDVPAFTVYSSEYDPPDKLSQVFGYYASAGMLGDTYLPSDIYFLNWKYFNVSSLPAAITVNPSDLATHNLFYDMPETYPENGLNIMNGFWFTWEYMAGSQGWGWDTHRVLAGMNATYYLAPKTATYFGYYMPTYGGWNESIFGPLQEWYAGRHYPYPQIPLERGETGNINLGEFQFAPYVPWLILQVTPGAGGSLVNLTGSIWAGLSWPHWDGGISHFPGNRTPYYEFYVDGRAVANGSIGRSDGTEYGGLWWDDVSVSLNATGERGLLMVHMPALATICNGTTYEADFDLSDGFSISPLFNSIIVPSGYSPGENIALEIEPADSFIGLLVEYSFDQGASWHVVEKTGGVYLIPTEMADAFSVRTTGTDVNGNSVVYVLENLSLSKMVRLDAPEHVFGAPGEVVEIPGNLTTVGGQALEGVAVSMSDGNTVTYTSPDEEGDFTFSYEIQDVPHELIISSPTLEGYNPSVVSVLIEPTAPSCDSWDVHYRVVGGQITMNYSPAGITPVKKIVPLSEKHGGYMTFKFCKEETNGSRLVVIPHDSWYMETILVENVMTGIDMNLSIRLDSDASGILYVADSIGDVDVSSESVSGRTPVQIDTIGDGTTDSAGSMLIPMTLVGDFNTSVGQSGELPFGMIFTTGNTSNVVSIPENPNMDGATTTSQGLPFTEEGGIGPYVGTNGTITATGTGDCLGIRLAGIRIDFQFEMKLELEPVRTADVNCDGSINVLDMIRIGQHWGQTGSESWILEDVNSDGIINVLDMIVIGQHWTG